MAEQKRRRDEVEAFESRAEMSRLNSEQTRGELGSSRRRVRRRARVARRQGGAEERRGVREAARHRGGAWEARATWIQRRNPTRATQIRQQDEQRRRERWDLATVLGQRTERRRAKVELERTRLGRRGSSGSTTVGAAEEQRRRRSRGRNYP